MGEAPIGKHWDWTVGLSGSCNAWQATPQKSEARERERERETEEEREEGEGKNREIDWEVLMFSALIVSVE